MNRYAQADEISVEAYLERNGAADVLAGDTISAALVRADGARAAGTADVVCTVVDLPTGLVRAAFSQGTTAAVVPGLYLVEFQITRSGARSTFRTPAAIEIYAGVVA